MKKLNFLKTFMFLICICLTTVNCSKDEENNIDNQQKLKSPELINDFLLSDGNKVDPKSKKDPGIKVTFKIGRNSRNCRGLGICKVEKVTIILREETNSALDEITVIAQVENDEQFILLQLNNNLDGTVFDNKLYVDETLFELESGISITEGYYELDSSIGEFGGYKIPLNI